MINDTEEWLGSWVVWRVNDIEGDTIKIWLTKVVWCVW